MVNLHADMQKPPAVIVFARAPSAGGTKTRLIPALGADGAADLYRCFLLDTLANLRDIDADVVVAAADEGDSESVSALVADVCPGAELALQSGSDLGERLANSVRDVLSRGHSPVVVIGSDAPSLPPRLIGEALRRAAESDLVLGPSFDGGYYLIGLRALAPPLFDGIEWGSDSVLCSTLERARNLHLKISLLEPWYDVDTPANLDHLRQHLARQARSSHPICCPRTWEYLCGLPEGAKA